MFQLFPQTNLVMLDKTQAKRPIVTCPKLKLIYILSKPKFLSGLVKVTIYNEVS